MIVRQALVTLRPKPKLLRRSFSDTSTTTNLHPERAETQGERIKKWTELSIPRLIPIALVFLGSTGFYIMERRSSARTWELLLLQKQLRASNLQLAAAIDELEPNYGESLESSPTSTSQEAGRVAAEISRQMAESKRVDQELQRVNSSLTSIAAEQDRVNKEVVRQKNEHTRVASELERVANALVAMQSEQIRVDSESQRVKSNLTRMDVIFKKLEAKRKDEKTKESEKIAKLLNEINEGIAKHECNESYWRSFFKQ